MRLPAISCFLTIQSFLTLWKGADSDPDIPILKQAKTEFASLD
jgi:hypothetical protein